MSTFFSILVQLIFMSSMHMYVQNPPRKLYIFGEEQHSSLVQHQLKLLYEDSSGLVEREIQIITVSNKSSLWKAFHVMPVAYAVVLIGKDGGEKYRANQLLQPATLYSIIDAMPMRKNEIQKRKTLNKGM